MTLVISQVKTVFKIFRIVSGYLDSVKGWKDKNTHRYKGYSFPGFLTNVVIKEALKSGNSLYHKMFIDWRPYHNHCNFCKNNFTVISKTETFNEDRMKILEMVGIEDEINEERKHVHTGNKTQEITRDMFKDIPEHIKRMLIGIYKFDFKLFDYDSTMY